MRSCSFTKARFGTEILRLPKEEWYSTLCSSRFCKLSGRRLLEWPETRSSRRRLTPFNFEITKLVRDVDNFLVVKVDNKRRRDAVPTLNTDWWNWRINPTKSLVEVPEIFIEDYSPQLKKGSLDELAGWVKLNGAVGTQEVQIKIPEAKVSQTVRTDNNGYAAIAFKARVQLWSTENPKLYELTLTSGGHPSVKKLVSGALQGAQRSC